MATKFPGKSMAYNLLKLTLPGISMTYYGEEIGMISGNDSDKDPTVSFE